MFCAVFVSYAQAAPDASYRIVDGQPIPVRWATGARKLPLKYESVPDNVHRDEAVSIQAVRREAVSFQVSIGPKLGGRATVEQPRMTKLTHTTKGDRISTESIELREVGRVRDRTREQEWPDVLFTTGTIDGVSDGYSYTLWNTVHVPSDATPGVYRGTVTMLVRTGDRTLDLRVPVKLRVHDYTLSKDVRVSTQLFSFNGESAQLWYDFEDQGERISYLIENVYPRYVANRMSPGTFVPNSKALFMRRDPIGEEGAAGRYRRFDGKTGRKTDFRIDQKRDFSVALWLKPDPDASGSFLTQWGGGARGFRWFVDGGRRIRLTFRKRVEQRDIDTLRFRVDPGTWSHLAVTVEHPDADQTVIKAYKNGEPVETLTIPGLMPSGRSMHLGSSYQPSVRPYTGGLDEVYVVQRVLPPDKIEQIMNGAVEKDEAAYVEDFSDTYRPEEVGRTYFETWGNYWRSRGLYLNQLPIPRKWNKKRIQDFFERMKPVINANDWQRYLYVRLPFDEATHGPKARKNRQFAKRMTDVAPSIPLHQTFGGGLRGDAIEKTLKPHADLVDIWCSVPGHYLKRFTAVKKWLYDRRQNHDAKLSWYIHHNISVGNKYQTAYSAMDLRGFFWRMFQEGVHMCALWSTTTWNWSGGKHGDRNMKRIERGFELSPSTPLGVGNGLLFYPGETADDMILDSIRAQVIRDGIEDYQYLYELQTERSEVSEGRVQDLDERFVRFGPTVDLEPEQLQEVRTRLAEQLSSE